MGVLQSMTLCRETSPMEGGKGRAERHNWKIKRIVSAR
jgi:hypothetical protein